MILCSLLFFAAWVINVYDECINKRAEFERKDERNCLQMKAFNNLITYVLCADFFLSIFIKFRREKAFNCLCACIRTPYLLAFLSAYYSNSKRNEMMSERARKAMFSSDLNRTAPSNCRSQRCYIATALINYRAIDCAVLKQRVTQPRQYFMKQSLTNMEAHDAMFLKGMAGGRLGKWPCNWFSLSPAIKLIVLVQRVNLMHSWFSRKRTANIVRMQIFILELN